jgi:hypothetical protein
MSMTRGALARSATISAGPLPRYPGKRGLLCPAPPRYNSLAWAPTPMAGFAPSTYGRF